MTALFGNQYQNKTVLITGHTGFKGSWLAYWLHQLGATVIGYSLPAPTTPSHWQLLDLPIISTVGTINDLRHLQNVVAAHQPDIVFHLAAQPLVRYAYQHPIETIETNVLGVAKVLECVRQTDSVKAVVIVTSDKCYENPEDGHPLTETDPMGGYDPYSMSKGGAELVVNSYRNSFFNLSQYGQTHETLVASVRAGNVIGGGDWASDRLIPDLIKGTVFNQPVSIRYPDAVRPWQHVLESLSGYLLIGQNLLMGNKAVATGWNFGPMIDDVLSVRMVIRQAQECWPSILCEEMPSATNVHEAHLLRLDCSKANNELAWHPIWSTQEAIRRTINWYRNHYTNRQIDTATDLSDYVTQATAANAVWAK